MGNYNSLYAYTAPDGFVLLHYNGSAWSYSPREIQDCWNTDFKGVWGSAYNNVYAVGDNCLVRYDGVKWTTVLTDTIGTYARGLWGSGPNDLFILAGGGIKRYDGSQLVTMNTNGEPPMYGVWGLGPENVYAVGFYGYILHYDGSNWSEMTSPTTYSLNSVWGSGPNDIYAVGQNNVVLHYNGSTWSDLQLPLGMDANQVYGFASDDVYVVSDYYLSHYDGASWQTSLWILGNAMWGSQPDHLHFFGDQGVILDADVLRFQIFLPIAVR